MKKPYPALCADCKHSRQKPPDQWHRVEDLRCHRPAVVANDEHALASPSGIGVLCWEERAKHWPIGKCGMRGALWEPKA